MRHSSECGVQRGVRSVRGDRGERDWVTNEGSEAGARSQRARSCLGEFGRVAGGRRREKARKGGAEQERMTPE